MKIELKSALAVQRFLWDNGYPDIDIYYKNDGTDMMLRDSYTNLIALKKSLELSANVEKLNLILFNFSDMTVKSEEDWNKIRVFCEIDEECKKVKKELEESKKVKKELEEESKERERRIEALCTHNFLNEKKSNTINNSDENENENNNDQNKNKHCIIC